MANPYSRLTLSFKDYQGKEPFSVTVNGPPLVGIDITVIDGLMDDVKAAVLAVTRGNFVGETRSYRVEDYSVDFSADTDKENQRETKLLVIGNLFGTALTRRIEIGALDRTLLAAGQPGSKDPDFLDLTAGEGLALKTALDAFWTSGDAHTLTVATQRAYHVGRNT
jgi:hypothetical protein